MDDLRHLPPLERAICFLQAELRRAPRYSAWLRQGAKNLGITRLMLERARRKLNIQSRIRNARRNEATRLDFEDDRTGTRLLRGPRHSRKPRTKWRSVLVLQEVQTQNSRVAIMSALDDLEKRKEESRKKAEAWYFKQFHELQERKPDRRTWSPADMDSMGYSVAESMEYLKQVRETRADLRVGNPHILSGEALIANRTFAKRPTAEAMEDFLGHVPLDDYEIPKHDGDPLDEFLSIYFADNDYNSREHWHACLYWWLFDRMREAGSSPIRPIRFQQRFDRIQDRVWKEEEAAEEAKARSERGRPPTAKSRMRDKIAATLGRSERHAYYVMRHGTTSLDQRKALAAAFADDPERCLPVHWEPRGAQRTPGRAVAKTFRAYCLTQDGEFDELAAFRAALLDAYRRGVLPDDFDSLYSLLGALDAEKVAHKDRQAFNFWHNFIAWRD